jgi:DNA polymerase III delta prime subunit
MSSDSLCFQQVEKEKNTGYWVLSKGNRMEHLALFKAWIEQQLERRQSDGRKFFPKQKRALPGLLILEGPAGCGKTTLIQEWLASLLPPGALTIPPAQRIFLPEEANQPTLRVHSFAPRRGETPFQTANRLQQELGGTPFGRTTTECWQTVASTVKNAQLDLLIVDQAERISADLGAHFLDYFPQANCSLLLVGADPRLTALISHPALEARIFCQRTMADFEQQEGEKSSLSQ